MKNSDINKKDVFLKRILESRWFYLVLFIFVIAYMFTDSRVLNLPVSLFWIRYSVCVFLLICFIVVRSKKYKQYYKRKFSDKVYVAGGVVGILFFSLIFQAILNIPINLLIEKNSKQGSNEVYNCEVIGVNTNAYDKVTFLFKERQYTRYYSLAGFPKGEIRKLYHVRLEVAESIFNTYSVKSLELERNEK